jgi:ribosomal protein S21
MIQIFVRDGESIDRFIKRFGGHIKSTRIAKKMRKLRYFIRPVTQRKAREAAVMREHYREEAKKRRFSL